MIAGMTAMTLLILSALLAPAPQAAGGGTDPAEVLLRLDERLQTIRTMRGRFVQTFTSSGLGVPQAEEGTFALRRPDLIRWEYQKPERKTAVSDGTHTWLHLHEQRLVYRGSVAEWREGGAFAALGGGRLAEHFVALEASAEGVVRAGNVLLRLVPKAPREEYEQLLIEFDPTNMMPSRITAVDPMGNRIGVSLERVEQNPALPRDLFVFEAPPGTEVIDQEDRGLPAR